MADDEKKNRAFAMLQEPLGVLGQMFGGALGTGLANMMNERVTLAAAALSGILADHQYNEGPFEAAKVAQSYGDALLERLEEVPDPRFPDEPEPLSRNASFIVYSDAVQRLCEAAENVADQVAPDPIETAVILRARVQAVRDAGKAL